jgi:hypothetical protein
LCGGGLLLVLVLGDGLGEVLGLVVLGLGDGVLVSLGLLDGLDEDLTDFDGDGVLLGVVEGVVVPLLLGVGDVVLVLVLLFDGLGLPLREVLCEGDAELVFVLVRADGVGLSVVVLVMLGVTPIPVRWWRRRCRRCAALRVPESRLEPVATEAVSAAAFGRTEQATFSIGPPVGWSWETALASATASPTMPRFSSAIPPASTPSASDLRTCILTWPASRSKFPPRVRIHAP